MLGFGRTLKAQAVLHDKCVCVNNCDSESVHSSLQQYGSRPVSGPVDGSRPGNPRPVCPQLGDPWPGERLGGGTRLTCCRSSLDNTSIVEDVKLSIVLGVV